MSGHLFFIYTEENEKWQDTLNLQSEELPGIREVLINVINKSPEVKNVEIARGLNQALEVSVKEIGVISEKIKTQQNRLKILTESIFNQNHTMTAFYDQEELRDELLRFEKKYLALKQKVQNYLLSVL
jgi:hypothetical protein